MRFPYYLCDILCISKVPFDVRVTLDSKKNDIAAFKILIGY